MSLYDVGHGMLNCIVLVAECAECSSERIVTTDYHKMKNGSSLSLSLLPSPASSRTCSDYHAPVVIITHL